MDFEFEVNKDNKLETVSTFSKITFMWVIPYFIKGWKSRITLTDLFKNSDENCAKRLADKFESYWNDELSRAKELNSRPKLIKPLKKMFFKKFILYACYTCCDVLVFRCLASISLSILIKLFSTDNIDKHAEQYIVGSIYCLCALIYVIFNELSTYKLTLLAIRTRVVVSSLIYRKMLRLNQKSLGHISAGKIANILSNDVNRIEMAILSGFYVIISPISLIILTYLTWDEVGVAALSGISFVILAILPTQVFIGKVAANIRGKVALKSDSRTKLMNEMVSGIKVIKMYAWEKPFKMLVKLVRADEMNYVYKSYMLRSFSYNTQALVQKITMFLTLITVYFMHNTLTASSAFTLLQYFNLLRYSVGILLPSAIIVIAELKTAIERIEEFLLEEEVENYLDETWFDSEILLENVQASWSPSSINIRIPEFEVLSGRLCAVVGPVGSGKSSLFQIILGELKPFTGRVRLNYNISYCSQESWLFSSSIRNNILFGQDYDPKKYKNVIKMCSLDKDLQLLPSGDQCLVGEKGVMLSGGQRARINLARALYKDAAIYLLDDPLSAVDAHVGRHLFDECVLKYLENKTRILITHQLQYLKEADVIFVMRDGKIEASGTFEELKDSDIGFENILSEMDKEQEIRKSEEYMSSCTSRRLSNVDMPTEEIPQNIKPFKEYIKAGGSLFFITYFFTVTLVCQVFYSLADFWLVVWTKDEVNRNITKIEFANMTEAIPKYVYEIFVTKSITATDLNLITYSTIIVLAILFSALRMFSTGRFIWKASTNLHSKMFNSLLKAPIIFFNTHPSGQILNRFSKDIGVTDQLLPVSLLESSQLLLISLGGLILISFSSYYLFIYVGTFVILLYVLFLLFSKVSSQVKHLEGITKSPVFTHVNHSLMGITTIRANKSEKLLIKQFDTHQDVHTSADFLFTACSTAYSVWINKLCVLLNICVTFYFIIRNHAGFPVDESFVGLALSQTLAFNVLLQYAIHRSSEVVNQMTSVERILAYTKLEKEPMHNPKGVELKQTWPCYGRIEFVNVYLSYKYDEEPVLKNLNFVIAPNQKIGVVGRTGAGKSSLINALFRLFEFQGAIIIDNINIGGIGLSSLRKKISIIPQEPVLFSNTVRYNLDPFNEYKDDEIWNAIIEVEMRDAIESLDYEITEGGANFSVGQRQLLCLARAILRKNKILVLDEATANVDLETDELIQTTLRNKFYSCTVLSIAHRLQSIMDADKVMVMHEGRLVEFDHPYLLLKDDKSMFYDLVSETGKESMKQLKQICYNNYHAKPSF